jgi:hypothetical protein
MTTPFTQAEIDAFNQVTTTQQWNAQLAAIKKARGGKLPSDYTALIMPIYDAYLERKKTLEQRYTKARKKR